MSNNANAHAEHGTGLRAAWRRLVAYLGLDKPMREVEGRVAGMSYAQAKAYGAKTHDYRQERWGWSCSFTSRKPEQRFLEKPQWIYYAVGHGRGIRPGDFVLTQDRDGVRRYRFIEISYYWDPRDMWQGKLVFDPGEDAR